MENFKELHHFKYDACFCLVVGLSVEGAFDVLVDLDAHFLADPPFGPALEQLDVERVGHAQFILDAGCPYLPP